MLFYRTIRDANALSLLVYLSTFPKDQLPTKLEMASHFGLGRNKLNRSLKYLRENKFISIDQKKDIHGLYDTVKISLNLLIKGN